MLLSKPVVLKYLKALSEITFILRCKFSFTGLGSAVDRVSAPRSGGTGCDPKPQLT